MPSSPPTGPTRPAIRTTNWPCPAIRWAASRRWRWRPGGSASAGRHAFGVRIGRTADEVTQLKGLAARPARVFDSRAEAAERHLGVSGLADPVAPDAPEALAGIVEAGGGFRPAADRGIYATIGPAVGDVCRAAAAPVRLAACEADPMASLAVLLPGLGHNCHIEAPEQVRELFERTLEGSRSTWSGPTAGIGRLPRFIDSCNEKRLHSVP